VDGKITTAEYRTFLARLEEMLSEASPISVMVEVVDLEGVEPGALLSDLKFGLTHLKSFHRMALVGDNPWLDRITRIPNPFPVEVRAYHEKDRHEAWDWLQE
jgi:hypothetical protein